MIPVRGYEGRKVAVLGLGRSGLAAARALRAGGAEVLCHDDSEKGRERAEAEGFALLEGGQRAEDWQSVSLVVVSPGIPHLYPAPHPLIRAAMEAGVPVDNDIGLFFRSWGGADWARFERIPRVVAVTGSNGKSTTSALIHHVLQEAGRPAQLGGNIGVGVLDLEPPAEGETVVLELSSYQIELARALTPDIAVFLNLSPDHLDRHGGIGGYFAAKRRLFAEGGPDRAVIGVDQPEGVFLANQIGAEEPDRLIRISTSRKLAGKGWDVVVRKGFLAEWRKGRQVASLDLRDLPALKGRPGWQNAAAAWGMLRALGLSPREIAPAFASFPGLPHRGQRVAQSGGVAFVNDSKATNVASAAEALAAHGPARWIAGGQAKAGGLAGIEPALRHVVKAYLIGAAAEDFARTLAHLSQGKVPFEICHDLETATRRASAEAAPGETVLLAPAAASFDQYADYAARGEHFTRIAQSLAEGNGGGARDAEEN